MTGPGHIRVLGCFVREQFRGPAEPDGRLAHDRNALNLIRLVCATAVMFSHAHDLALPQVWQDATVHWLSMPVATTAVFVFFILSGFLVTMSYDRRRKPGAFIRARALRILPDLWVMLLVMVPVLGLLFPSGIFLLTGLIRWLALPFLLGTAAYVFRDRLPLSGVLAGVGLVIALALPTGTITPNLVQPALNLAELKTVAVQLAFGYAALVFAFRAPAAVTRFSAGLPDLSYGV